MKKKLLRPDQIITLRDYPVFNPHILVIFFRVFSKGQGKILPPCPVIHKSSGIPYVREKDAKTKKYNTMLEKYLADNPRAEYFLLDGSHKTSAATLANRKIPVIVIEKDADLPKIKKRQEHGEFFGFNKPPKTIKAGVKELREHFIGTNKFWTVKEKVDKMVKEKIVPNYMIRYYRK
jgi:hypothetical protein